MMDLLTLRTKVERLKGKREQLEDLLQESEDLEREEKVNLSRHQKALEVVKHVAIKTQQQLNYNISSISSMAMEAVFEDPYEVVLEFVERRNKTECDILFVKRANKIHPFSGGGGALDVASFALRVASYSMQQKKPRNTLILDEPFKHLKGETANVRMLEMVGEISDKIDVQIIMVSDERVSRAATLENTDRLFDVEIRRGVSKVSQEK